MNNIPPGYPPYPPAGYYTPYPAEPVTAPAAGAPMAYPGYPYAAPVYVGTPPAAPPVQATPPTGTFSNPNFLKGAVIGGLAAYLLTNDNVQQALIRNSVKVWALFQGGIEEMKERFRDAEAELHAGHADGADPE